MILEAVVCLFFNVMNVFAQQFTIWTITVWKSSHD